MLEHEWRKGNKTAYLKDYSDETIYLEMPLVRIANKMIDMADEGIPLTQNGNPKLAVLKELYPFGPKDWYTERHPEKQIRMNTCPTLSMVWYLFHDIGLFRKFKHTVRLSRMGRELKDHPQRIAHHLFNALQTTADTSLLDGFEMDGFNDSLESVAEMLYIFGEDYQLASFYADKYAENEPLFGYFYNLFQGENRNNLVSCFEVRIMVRFFKWFGLVEELESYYDEEKGEIIPAKFKTTPLFKKLIAIDFRPTFVYPLYYINNNYTN